MKEYWNPDPEKRPTAVDIFEKIDKMYKNEWKNFDDPSKITEIISSLDIGPVMTNNPGAIYKSRPLSGIIQSAMSTTRSLRSQSITSEVGK